MDTRYKNKPTEKVVNRYVEKIEHFLSAHNLSLMININDFPVIAESCMDGETTNREHRWVGEIFIETTEIGKVKIKLSRFGINDNLKKEEIWRDACDIQNQIYKNLKISPGDPNGDDPYWRLWSYLKNY